jgi:hypothetical protein
LRKLAPSRTIQPSAAPSASRGSMIIDDTIRDDAIWHAWSAFGGRSWRPLELWQTLPPAVRDRALARVYSNAAPFRAAVVALGRALADAAAAGSVTAHGLGVTRSKSGAYCAIQRSAGAAIPVVDRADALEQLRSLRLELATIAERLQVAIRAAAILEDAIARAPGADGVAETVDVDVEILGAIGRAHGDAWKTARQLAPITGSRGADRLARLVGVELAGFTLQADTHPAKGWKIYRVVAS